MASRWIAVTVAVAVGRLAHARARRPAARAMEHLLLPLVDVEINVLPLLAVLRALPARARKPEFEVFVVAPVTVVQLGRGVGLQRVARHVVENVEERLQLEL